MRRIVPIIIIALMGGFLGAFICRKVLPHDTAPDNRSSFETRLENAVSRVLPSTVTFSLKENRNPFRMLDYLTNIVDDPKFYSAAGIAIGKGGLIVTNAHVVSEFKSFYVTTHEGETYAGKPVKIIPALDLAIVRIPKDLPTVELCQFDKVKVGKPVFSVGTPFRLPFSISLGIISAKNRGRVGFSDIEDYIQTDAAINPGSSGGPLCDLDGKLVGLNSSIYSLDTRGSNGIGFAIPSYLIRSVLDNVIEGKPVGQATLGIRPATLDFQTISRLNYTSTRGSLVTGVTQGSPAQMAGVKVSDVVYSLNGSPVDSPFVLRALLYVMEPEETATLGIFRDGKHITIETRLARINEDDPPRLYLLGLLASFEKPDANTLLKYGISSGATAAEVDYVDYNGVAWKLGLKSNDLVLTINGSTFANLSKMQELLDSAIATGELRIRYIDSQTQTEQENTIMINK